MADTEMHTTMDARKIMREFTMEVTLTHATEVKVRRWVALRLIRLAARILGTGIEIKQ